MKIVTWNCNGALRKKTAYIDSVGADILVIQECEDPTKSTQKYRQWAGVNYLWEGETKNKGIGVFSRNGQKLKILNWNGTFSIKGIDNNSKSLSWSSDELQSFLPLMIDEKYILVAIWTKKANSPNFGYIGQFWKYIQIHKSKFKSDNVILCGDLNSNAIWDEHDRWWNHSDVVKELEDISIGSLYHHVSKEQQGQEAEKTFYMYRNYDKSYHIDYVFMSVNLINRSSLRIHDFSCWSEYSDHVPLEFCIQE